ncbi:hypothetical protein B0187_05740 [Haemophilus paracuniculus]|uniref:Uncharacterized protein n=1 Tax=Haemophilus paracuniculus TaxID=734 RepID=A0A1T0AST6_9PAST|nr:hypothetical protein [Haemophilus paracuniculus]OOR99258.1 hypothetical protein B0187_05740 [Haemophilus paracuniculus]
MIGLIYFFGVALFFGGLFWFSILGIIIAVAASVFIGVIALSLVVVFWRFIAIGLGLFLGWFLLFLMFEDIPLTLSILFGLAVVLWFVSENSDKETEVKENSIEAEIESIKRLGKNPHYR